MEKNSVNRSTPPKHVVKAAVDIWSRTSQQHLIPISGRSMLPLIRNGDSVLVKHGRDSVKRGDIIVFQQDERMLAHRILYIERDNLGGDVFVAKGDNNFRLDLPVKEDQVIGRVLEIRRGEKTLSIDTPIWRVLNLFIALGMLGLSQLYRGVRCAERWVFPNRDESGR